MASERGLRFFSRVKDKSYILVVLLRLNRSLAREETQGVNVNRVAPGSSGGIRCAIPPYRANAPSPVSGGVLPERNNGSEDNEILPSNPGQAGSSDNQGRMDSARCPFP